MRKRLTILLVLGIALGVVHIRTVALRKVGAQAEDPLPRCQDIDGDGQSNIGDAVFLLTWLFRGGPAPSCPIQAQHVGIPFTGQGNCYDSDGMVGPCDGSNCPGQDGFYRAGCQEAVRYVDNGDGTLTDACTGLMWQRDTSDVNGDGRGDETDSVGWCAALMHCEDLTLGGHEDWRLPNVRELESLVDYGRSDPAVDPVFGAVPKGYWSSTTIAKYPENAMVVHFEDGIVNINGKNLRGLVRAVRAAR